MEPKYIEDSEIITPSNEIQVVYKCTSNRCGKLFIASYVYSVSRVGSESYVFVSSEPKTEEPVNFSETITQVSPSFVQIYNQAATAESLGLTEICGAGYRKSLEFLVKDYLIHKNPDQESSIKSQFLGSCIRSIEDYNIKFCADRASWLGNDETHYVRKWENSDLSDLKTLINLVSNWVENALMMEKYEAEMAQGR
ncbi:hypothetical protein ABER23_08550 [Paenibacillus lautus]|uniref:hypothetical protein n=1 Tax=Paenibacillus lautus TaxID=1401 RepID=UPI003D2D0EC0